MRAGPIGHLDADCFYVSAERVRDAFLIGKAVGVLGNQGACVIAKSYEMKAAGVKTGEPIWDAIKKCPQGVYVKRDFRWYEVLSRAMLEVVRQFSPRVEYYSIDEFFFEAVSLPGDSFQATAEALRDRVLQVVGVPVTVGFARSKTLAKRPVTDITGIAGRRAARLAPHGILTCLDYAQADRRFLRSLLTRVGEALWYELNGEPVNPLHTERPPHQMLSRGGSIGKQTADPNVLFAWVVRNLERLVEELEYYGIYTGHLTVWVGYRDGHAGEGRARLLSPTDRFDLLLEAAKHSLRQAYRAGLLVNRVHLFAADLRWRGSMQQGLFDPPAEQARAVAQAKRDINASVRRFAVRSGATLYLDEVYQDSAQDFDICDVHGKMCF